MSPFPARTFDRGTRRTPRLRGAPAARHPRALFACALALAVVAAAPPARPAPAPGMDAETLVLLPPSPERTRALSSELRGAKLDPLLRLLRHGADRLGPDERAIAEAAYKLTPAGSADLRRRLEARRLLAQAEGGRRVNLDVANLRALRPRQSVWRVGAVLPDRGDYAGYAASVRTALEAGLSWGGSPEPFVVEDFGTGDAEPARVAAAVDSAADACGVLVGELLSEPTFALAAGARLAGLPVVSPTATDETIGHAGPAVFQVGPPSGMRGEALARTILGGQPRKLAILTSTGTAKSPLVTAFAATAESLGAAIVRRDVYPSGGGDFRSFSRGLRTFGAEVLFWDGDSREAVALLRQLGADGVSVHVCGGTALSPEQFHSGEKVLLEGVTWVADDWRLAPAHQAVVDSLAAARGEHAGALWTRGFLAGRRIAAAVAAGARTPAELVGRLAHRDPVMRAGGWLDCGLEGATLPVWTIRRGEAVDADAP